MSLFLRLLSEDDKAAALQAVCNQQRAGGRDARVFEVESHAFDAVPGKPFAYWVSEAVRESFLNNSAFENETCIARLGGHSSNDERWLRLFWEISKNLRADAIWVPYAKGGVYSKFYADVYLYLHWEPARQTYFAFFGRVGRMNIKPESVEHYFRPGLTWPRRTQGGLSLRAMPRGCIFADKGPAAFVADDDPDTLLALLALVNSQAFGLLVSLQMAFGSYEVGVIQKTPVPDLNPKQQAQLAALARRAWSLKRTLDTISETSHAFILPAALRARLGDYDPPAIEAELARIQAEIDAIAFDLYGFAEADRLAVVSGQGSVVSEEGASSPVEEEDDDETAPADHRPLSTDHRPLSTDHRPLSTDHRPLSTDHRPLSTDHRPLSTDHCSLPADHCPLPTDHRPLTTDHCPLPTDHRPLPTDHCSLTTDHLLSWAVGVAFGRFDWRLATGERAAPPEPDPFDPLPAKSLGMLPEGEAAFHSHPGILVDEPGHPHDLARLVEEVLERVIGEQGAVATQTLPTVHWPLSTDSRRWLQKDFFPFHLQRYSKSRRKAPIYWPLATTSGSYRLWVYYPSLSSQTLYTAINDFIEPKLKQVGSDVTALRNKGTARSRDDEKQFEALQTFELELIELRDTLLGLAPSYKPNQDDGVQISAAPLWPLFRHKPWQKVLKDTWAKLQKGDYDWAMLAMNYWPERVREKCKTDKSLAIAHGLEDVYIEPEAAPKKTRGRKKGE